jgi:putative heme transporter
MNGAGLGTDPCLTRTTTSGGGVKPGRSAPPRRRRRWRAVALSAVTVGVLVAVFAGVFPRFAHYSQAWSSIRGIPAEYLIALAVAAIVNIAVGAWPLQAALPGLGYRRAFVVGQTSYAMSNALPAGGAVGLGVEYDMLESYGFGTGAAAGASAISTVFNVYATLVMPVLGVLALLFTGQLRWHYVLIAIVGTAAVGVSGTAMAAILRSEGGARRVGRRLDRCLTPVTRRLLRGRTVNLSGKVLDFRSDVVEVMKARWPAVIGSTLLPQLTLWSILLVALRGLEHGAHGHSGVTWAESLAALSFAMVVSFIPVTAGGLGTVDATLTGLLSAFGATGSQALAVDVVWRAASFIPQVLTGALTFLWWRATARQRRRR